MKVALSLVMFVLLIISSVYGLAIYQQSRETSSNFSKEGQYEKFTILKLGYGNETGKVGLIEGGEDVLPSGPESFAVTDAKIYILDTVNERVQIFHRDGKFDHAILNMRGSDMVVKNGGTVFVFDPSLNTVLEYQPVTSSMARYRIPGNFVGSLEFDENNNLNVRISEEKVYTLNMPDGKFESRTVPERYTYEKIDERRRKIVEKQLVVATDVNILGSIEYLGDGPSKSMFVIVEELLPAREIHVKKEIRWYDSNGRLKDFIPIEIDYVAHPTRELILDEKGNIYHLRPLQNHLLVEQWRRRG